MTVWLNEMDTRNEKGVREWVKGVEAERQCIHTHHTQYTHQNYDAKYEIRCGLNVGGKSDMK